MFLAYDIETKIGNDWNACYNGTSGIACVCVIDIDNDIPFIFMDDNLSELTGLLSNALGIITWNGNRFDDLVLMAHGINVGNAPRCDLMQIFQTVSRYRKGWKLETIAKRNLGEQKSTEAFAPDLYQTGRYGELLTYCMKDTWMLAQLYRQTMAKGFVIGPKGEKVYVDKLNIFKKIPDDKAVS